MTNSRMLQSTLFHPTRFIALLATGLLGFGSIGCGEAAGSVSEGTGQVASLGEACEAWCTDEGCRAIFIAFDSIDECRSSCVNDNASAACAGPYASYISCQANGQCATFCQNENIAWGACEAGSSGDIGVDESLTAVCERGCATDGCEGFFFGGPTTQCLINCSRAPRGCEDPYRDFMQCKVNTTCTGACRDDGLALAECSRNN